MNFNLKKKIVIILVSYIFSFSVMAQVTIGSNEKPVEGSILQLKNVTGNGSITATKGLLLPRVALTDLNRLYPMFENDPDYVNGVTTNERNLEHIGLVVYNLGCQMTGEGFYVWSGNKWIAILPKQIQSTDVYKGANCYIAKTDSKLNIPVQRAFRVWKDYQKAGSNATDDEIDAGKVLDLTAVNNLEGNLTVEVLWEQSEAKDDTDVLASVPTIAGTGENAEIQIVTSDKTGNVVLALKINNKVLWTWHIWIPRTDPTHLDAQIYCYGGLVWMDRNLGATDTIPNSKNTYGLYYQFGRMLPFKNGTQGQFAPSENKKVNETLNLALAIQSPNFITDVKTSNVFNDWYSDVSGIWTSRWSGNGEPKSPFDPCPEGWRVPFKENNESPWPEFTNTTKPNNWNDGFYYYTSKNVSLGYWPAAGNITFDTAKYDQLSEIGSNWSATYTGRSNKYHRLLFSQPIILIDPRSLLTNALSIRCVAEYE